MKNLYSAILFLLTILLVVSTVSLVDSWKNYESHLDVVFLDLEYSKDSLKFISTSLDNPVDEEIEILLDNISSDLTVVKKNQVQIWESSKRKFFHALIMNSIIMFLSIAIFIAFAFLRNQIFKKKMKV